MATLNREAIEQEIGKRFEKIEKTLERTLEKTLEKAIGKAAEFANSPTATRAQLAAEKAKKSLDDVLLGLEHKGINVKAPQDLIQTVGRRVLERASEIAEDVRSQVAAKPYSPDWLKNVTDVAAAQVQKRAAGAAAPVRTAGATEADAALATDADAATDAAGVTADASEVTVDPSRTVETTVAAGATEGDGELAEAAEDSKEERASGAFVKSETKSAAKAVKKASRKKE